MGYDVKVGFASLNGFDDFRILITIKSFKGE
jgi:hypothetical protein